MHIVGSDAREIYNMPSLVLHIYNAHLQLEEISLTNIS